MILTKEERDKIFECSGQNHEIHILAWYTEDKIEIYCMDCEGPDTEFSDTIGKGSKVLVNED